MNNDDDAMEKEIAAGHIIRLPRGGWKSGERPVKTKRQPRVPAAEELQPDEFLVDVVEPEPDEMNRVTFFAFCLQRDGQVRGQIYYTSLEGFTERVAATGRTVRLMEPPAGV